MPPTVSRGSQVDLCFLLAERRKESAVRAVLRLKRHRAFGTSVPGLWLWPFSNRRNSAGRDWKL